MLPSRLPLDVETVQPGGDFASIRGSGRGPDLPSFSPCFWYWFPPAHQHCPTPCPLCIPNFGVLAPLASACAAFLQEGLPTPANPSGGCRSLTSGDRAGQAAFLLPMTLRGPLDPATVVASCALGDVSLSS